MRPRTFDILHNWEPLSEDSNFATEEIGVDGTTPREEDLFQKVLLALAEFDLLLNKLSGITTDSDLQW